MFFPYSYQVGGFTMFVPRAWVQPLDMRLEDAMRFIVTAGAKAGETKSTHPFPPTPTTTVDDDEKHDDPQPPAA